MLWKATWHNCKMFGRRSWCLTLIYTDSFPYGARSNLISLNPGYYSAAAPWQLGLNYSNTQHFECQHYSQRMSSFHPCLTSNVLDKFLQVEGVSRSEKFPGLHPKWICMITTSWFTATPQIPCWFLGLQSLSHQMQSHWMRSFLHF